MKRQASLAWISILCLAGSCTEVSGDGGSWSPPERIDDDTYASDLFALALDAHGVATILWSDNSFDMGSALVWRHAQASGWTPVERIDSDGGDVFRARLAVEPGGDVIAVWDQKPYALLFPPIECPPNCFSIWGNDYSAARGWGTAARLDSIETDASDADVAVDGNGNAIAVWHQFDGTRESIWAARFVRNDGWSTAAPIEADNRGHASDPRVALDPAGNAIAVWGQTDGVHPADIRASRFTPDDGWSEPKHIGNGELHEARLPEIAIDSNGSATAVWHQSDGARFYVWSNRFVPPIGWGTAMRIDPPHTGDADHAKVGADGEGNAIAIWKQLDAKAVEIWSNRYVSGEGWGNPTRIDSSDLGDALPPTLAVSATGDALAGWPQFDGVRYDVWSNRYRPSEGWGIAERIDPTDRGSGDPIDVEVAIDPEGRGMAVWHRRDPNPLFVADAEQSSFQLWTARYE